VEFSPVTDFREATCRQYEENTCTRGGYEMLKLPLAFVSTCPSSLLSQSEFECLLICPLLAVHTSRSLCVTCSKDIKRTFDQHAMPRSVTLQHCLPFPQTGA